MDPYRGKTFSPASEWRDGGREFAKAKLEEVRSMLCELANEEEAKPRRRWWCFWRSERALARRVNWQRVYDLRDASRTIGDARFRLGGLVAADVSMPVEEREAFDRALNEEVDEWPFDDEDPPDPL